MTRLLPLLALLAGCASSAGADLRLIAGSTRVIAHRGGTGPDGTIAGCLRTLDRGVVFLELDVRLTEDGQAVILHDPTVDRTTDGHGPVDRMTLAELKRLDAGKKFDPAYAGERVPTVAEMLRAVGPRGVVLLELKVPAAAGAVIEAIRSEAAFNRAVPRSSDLAVLRKMGDLEPRVLAGTMAEVPSADQLENFARTLADARVRTWTPLKNDRVSRAVVDRMHERGIAVWGTNTNDPAVWSRLAEAGVDGIITDRPDDLARALDR